MNEPGSVTFEQDVRAAVSSSRVGTLVIPKVHGERELNMLHETMDSISVNDRPLRIVASIESARAIRDIHYIASWRTEKAYVSALLVSLFSSPVRFE